MKKLFAIGLIVVFLVASAGLALAKSDGPNGPAPGSGDGVSDGSANGPAGPSGEGDGGPGPAPSSGDGVSEGPGW